MVLDRKRIFEYTLLTGLILLGPSTLTGGNCFAADASTTQAKIEEMPGSESKMEEMTGLDTKMEEMTEHGSEMKDEMTEHLEDGSESKMDEKHASDVNEEMAGTDTKMDEMQGSDMKDEMAGSDTKGMDGMGSEMAMATQGKININAATPNDLYSLPGVGPSLAAKIVIYRDANGAFETIENLVKIKGINSRTMELIGDKIYAGPLGEVWVQESPVEESVPEVDSDFKTDDDPTSGTAESETKMDDEATSGTASSDTKMEEGSEAKDEPVSE